MMIVTVETIMIFSMTIVGDFGGDKTGIVTSFTDS